VFNKLYEEKIEANSGIQYLFTRTSNQCSVDMSTRKVELFYYPVFKGSHIRTNEELRQKIAIYFTHHPDLKPQKNKPWYRSNVSPGFNHKDVDCYIIVSPKPLKEPDGSDGTVRYSSIELYNFLREVLFLWKLLKTFPRDLSWFEETDCTTLPRVRGCYSLLFHITLIQTGLRTSCETVYVTTDPSFEKFYFILPMSSLCKNARKFEKNQVITIKIMHVVGRRFVDKYREFHSCSFLISRMRHYSDIKCMEITLVYQANMKPCGFDSVYSDSQL